MPKTSIENPWEGDKLGFEEIGASYTRLIKSIDDSERDSKVISIEAGFGHGKTFFRTAWAKHLRQLGEIVIEIDAQQSDHSGDPVVTFLGTLLALIPKEDTTRRARFFEKAKKIAVVGSKVAVNAVARGAADQIGEAIIGDSGPTDAEAILADVVDGVGSELSKYLGNLISHQLKADEARTKELPEHLKVLFDTITEGSESKRIVVIIDELDRCHPDYAIALLEAMKLVFSQPGFVFILMVNAEHLEALANKRFSDAQQGERYLDKFVDIRLQLPRSDEAIGAAAAYLVNDIPLIKPFGDAKTFGVEGAITLTQVLAPLSQLSMRQVKRTLLKAEIAVRCYAEVPIDLPLLIYLAFKDNAKSGLITENSLPRARLTRKLVDEFEDEHQAASYGSQERLERDFHDFISSNCSDLLNLDNDRYYLPKNGLRPGQEYTEIGKIKFLGKHYLKSHQDMLEAVHLLQAPNLDEG